MDEQYEQLINCLWRCDDLFHLFYRPVLKSLVMSRDAYETLRAAASRNIAPTKDELRFASLYGIPIEIDDDPAATGTLKVKFVLTP